MFEKAERYYADWRDTNGTRLRKSFTSKRAALQFEAEQKELAHPKIPAREQHWPRFSAPHSATRPNVTPASTNTKSAKSSSIKLVSSRRPK